MAINEYVHGCRVVAWIQTEMQGDKPCGYIMVYNTDKAEYITCWYRQGDYEWNTGIYFQGPNARENAYLDLIRRSEAMFLSRSKGT
jgi:hypothetical protein